MYTQRSKVHYDKVHYVIMSKVDSLQLRPAFSFKSIIQWMYQYNHALYRLRYIIVPPYLLPYLVSLPPGTVCMLLSCDTSSSAHHILTSQLRTHQSMAGRREVAVR